MDMTVEIVVYMGVGIILIGLLSIFLINWDFTDDAETLQQLLADEKITDDRKLDRIGFTNAARDFWNFCNHTYAPEPRIFYVYDSQKQREGTLDMDNMFELYRELGHCKSIQSVNRSCGRREDINMTNISLPAVIRVTCVNNTLFIR